jgi:predicted small integral membrane protein|tara:strand:+ start:757 stop:966 length:210 start_codon:yes stop_codon:yes gene_type:complete
MRKMFKSEVRNFQKDSEYIRLFGQDKKFIKTIKEIYMDKWIGLVKENKKWAIIIGFVVLALLANFFGLN